MLDARGFCVSGLLRGFEVVYTVGLTERRGEVVRRASILILALVLALSLGCVTRPPPYDPHSRTPVMDSLKRSSHYAGRILFAIMRAMPGAYAAGRGYPSGAHQYRGQQQHRQQTCYVTQNAQRVWVTQCW